MHWKFFNFNGSPMIERITELVLDESKWLSMAMLLSIIAVFVLISRQRR